MQKFFVLFLLLAGTLFATGQSLWQKQGLVPYSPECYASDEVNRIFIPPPDEVLNLLKSAEKTSEIIVFYDLFPNEAIAAFEYAVSIWERLISSPVPIYIEAYWRPLRTNVLGSCAPTGFEKNFTGAPHHDIYYPISLVEKITNTQLTGPSQPDIFSRFNENINWYFGTDGNTPASKYDFVSVVMHEIGHGLGFTGFFFIENQEGGYEWFDTGDVSSFDRLVVNLNNIQLVNTSVYNNPSSQLEEAFTSNLLFANSPVAIIDGGGSRPRLYSPSNWNEGSSIYHLNDATYRSTPNALMTHAFGSGEAIHDPGPVTMGILADMGWKTMQIFLDQNKDIEEVGPVPIEVEFVSDFPLDPNEVFVVVSYDLFTSSPDSIPLFLNDQGFFEAEIEPGPGTEILHYYISAGDIKNRVFNFPSGAPDDNYVINIGADNVDPVIHHEPIPFYFKSGNDLVFVADVFDNLGVDTVYVEYSINGVEQLPFGLNHDSLTFYTAVFPVNADQLNDGDIISYNIVAVDASVARNSTRDPDDSSYSFRVENMYEPVLSYSNDFNNETNDFILTDFDVIIATNFGNGALHSPHPYPSPGEDDVEYNLLTILKHPVILTDEAFISYDEIVLVEPGTEGTRFGDFEFWDYVIVEGSKDGGDIWLPLIEGYDSRENSVWEEEFTRSITEMNSNTAGIPDWYIRREIDMLENGNFLAGDTIIIRFRLFSDPYTHGWGWAIDNLEIQTGVTSDQPILSPGNILVYPNPFTGSFKVRTEPKKMIEELQLEIFNLFGQKISSVIYNNVSGPVTTDMLIRNNTSGFYFLVVKENGRQVFTKKLIHN